MPGGGGLMALLCKDCGVAARVYERSYCRDCLVLRQGGDVGRQISNERHLALLRGTGRDYGGGS